MVDTWERNGFRYDTEEESVFIPWFNQVLWHKKTKVLELNLNPALKPYLTQLQDGYFTSYKLFDIIDLRSAYALRLYDRLKGEQYRCKEYAQINNDGEREKIFHIGYQQLRDVLGVTAGKYPLASNFVQIVLSKSVEAINDHTDIIVTFSVQKKNRKIVSFSFDILSKNPELNERVQRVKLERKSITFVEKAFPLIESEAASKRKEIKKDIKKTLQWCVNELGEEKCSSILDRQSTKDVPDYLNMFFKTLPSAVKRKMKDV